MSSPKIFIIFCLLLAIDAHSAGSDEAWDFYIENDSRNIGGPGSDSSYSDGIKLSYIYAEDRVPDWAKPYLMTFEFLEKELGKSKTNFGLSVGQQIYTPSNTDLKTPVLDDRPYAAWLYVGFAASFKHEKVGNFIELDVGVVGPSARGEEIQNNFHDVIGVPRAEGWDNSLHDEPALQLSYQRRHQFFRQEGWDFIPYYGAGFGNVLIAAHLGGVTRFGIHLPDDFGPSRPSGGDGDGFVPTTDETRKKNSYYVFVGGRGNATLRSIFLDGNSFQSSHHVKKYPFTFDTEFGFGTQIQRFGIIWRFVTRSPEFEQRSIFNSFASINFTYYPEN